MATEDEKKKVLPTPATQRFGQPYTPRQFGQPVTTKPYQATAPTIDGSISPVPTATTPATEETPKYKTYEDIMADLKTADAEQKEQTEQLRRRERTKGVISAIGDAGSAIANLISASNYAPNALPAGTPTLSGKAKERYERLKAEIDKTHDQRVQRILQDKSLSDEERKFQYSKEKEKWLRETEEEKLKLNKRREDRYDAQNELQAIRLGIQQGTLDLKQQELELKRLVAEGKITEAQAKIELGWAKLYKSTNRKYVRDDDGNVLEVYEDVYPNAPAKSGKGKSTGRGSGYGPAPASTSTSTTGGKGTGYSN